MRVCMSQVHSPFQCFRNIDNKFSCLGSSVFAFRAYFMWLSFFAIKKFKLLCVDNVSCCEIQFDSFRKYWSCDAPQSHTRTAREK